MYLLCVRSRFRVPLLFCFTFLLGVRGCDSAQECRTLCTALKAGWGHICAFPTRIEMAVAHAEAYSPRREEPHRSGPDATPIAEAPVRGVHSAQDVPNR